MFSYIAGNMLKHAINTSMNIKNKGKIPIINFAVENDIGEDKIIKEYNNILKFIQPGIKVALKGSLFNFDYVLLDKIINDFIRKDVQIIIDAEEDLNYQKYKDLTYKFLLKYNKDYPYIVKTYQMYRKDSRDELKDDIFNKNFILGAKLVRGAYWNTDNKFNNLYIDKFKTDYNYNLGILELYNNNKNGYNLLATHNKESINLGRLYNFISPQFFEFAHLLGMENNILERFSNDGERVNVYIPYGPYKYMLPYLSRRLYENIDMLRYML